MAEKKSTEGCSYLLVKKTKRATLFLVAVTTFALFLFLLFTHFLTKESWTSMIAPILLVAAPLLAFPLTETWAYEPWQAKPCKYEHHHMD
jgi:hypothetical protein